MIRKVKTDVLVIGMGGAAEMAVLNAYDANPDLEILIVTKALRGKGGCSRMVQGGLNVVLHSKDSHEKHLMDTLKGGQYINDQQLAMTMVEQATPTIKEMETKYGCFFDRNPDGTVHQKPFAGQSFDRTVHKGDLTGIEIISRLTEQVMKRDISVLEEHRAVDLLIDTTGEQVVGALILDIKNGEFIEVNAKATLLATGGGPTHYRFFAPGPEKSVDGLGMLYRAAVVMRDMEMVQFHPTGLIIPGSVVAGSLLEEGLRGAGAHMLNIHGERFMERYDPEKMERTTRDIMCRSSYLEIQAGRACREGGVHIDASHLGAEFVEKNFPGMVSRCRQFKYDLARQPVPVSPSAHYIMGGAAIDVNCRTSMERLFVAGEDAGGVHGANRLGGNGICDSCVFGRQAGKAIAHYLAKNDGQVPESASGMAEQLINRYMKPFEIADGTDPFELRDRLRETNWNKVGVARTGSDLSEAIDEIDSIAGMAENARIAGLNTYNMPWNVWIDLLNMIDVSKMVAGSAMLREETRGAHFRLDCPDQRDDYGIFNIFQKRGANGTIRYEKKSVAFSFRSLDQCQKYKK
ncbi:MAG: FAD-binding protein [Proteobacteria bacterium]|nr:FAD-binding protein [Pseudomonadota bacterium]MBU1713087.1 FAD-binding protein [Pseudomonadota bacterium]